MVGVAAVPAIGALCYVGYYLWVPRYSAVATFEDTLDINLRLDFYLTEPDARESGRYLSVINSMASDTFNIPGWDWARKARTSIYRIDANHLAVLSAMGNDFMVTIKPFAFAPVISDNGEQWRYLGAFDFAFAPGERPRLEFFDGQLAECIPMATTDATGWAGKPRAHARQATCPSPRSH